MTDELKRPESRLAEWPIRQQPSDFLQHLAHLPRMLLDCDQHGSSAKDQRYSQHCPAPHGKGLSDFALRENHAARKQPESKSQCCGHAEKARKNF